MAGERNPNPLRDRGILQETAAPSLMQRPMIEAPRSRNYLAMKRMMKRFHVAAALLGGSLVLLAGCTGRPGRVDPPDYPSDAGAAAVDAYDANGDDAIGGAELDRVPALRASLKQVDTDGDGLLTAREIDARIQSWLDTRTAEMTVRCEVLLDGSPLANAQIVFEPEPFLGPNVKPASAVTGANGAATVSMAAEHLADPRYSGVACGWYKIRVTSKDRKIPARYNTETTLGCEVAMNAHWVGQDRVLINLRSK